MNKAIFLDRDGVINDDTGHYYIFKPENFIINDGIIESLNEFQEHNYLLIIISNQGGIAKKLYSKTDVEVIHNILINTLRKNGIEITEIYYCPHHTDIEKCICRKPNTQLIEKAVSKFDIDIKKSYFIGDNERDIAAAKYAGLKPVKIESNENLLKYCKFIIENTL